MKPETDEQLSAGKLFVPSLTVVYFSLFIVDTISINFLLDVALTFFGSQEPLYIALTSQLQTVSGIVASVFALFLAIASVKFSYKNLLLIGMLFIPIGTLGCSFAPDFISLQFFFVLEAIGSVIVTTMAIALVGKILPLNKRPHAIGWIISGSAIAGILGAFIINFFFSTGNWRSFLQWYGFPISLISLVAAYFGIPSEKKKHVDTIGTREYFRTFKQVVLNKSAATCLIGSFIRMVSIVWGLYLTTFLRVQFGLDLGSAVLLTGLPMAIIITVGQIVGGYLTNCFGRKKLSVVALLIHGATLPLIAILPDLWLALIIGYSGTLIGAMAMPAVTNLILEQTPNSRGTILSINSILQIIGGAVGTALAGVILVLLNYIGVFLVFGGLIILAAIFFFFTKDPCITSEV